MGENQEYSAGGSKIFRYTDGEKEWEAAKGEESIKEISDHIEKYIGKVDSVLHEMISDTVHIDVHHVKPTENQRIHFLITSGMSDLPMRVDGEFEYLELMIVLPEFWKVDQAAFDDEAWYWPVRILKYLARFPHKYNTWFGYGHSIPNGNPPETFAKNTKLNGIILLTPSQVPDEFLSLKVSEDKTIKFLVIMPLYQEEMDLKLKKGTDVLVDKFIANNINDIVDLERKNVGKKLFGIF